ncbi:MAG: response regulator transcription factor [Hyphomicrobiales bacterium]
MEAGVKKIIIVDDSEIYRTGLRELINRHEQLKVVAEAECGEQAIETIRRVPADLVLLDLSLPRSNGFKVLKEIRKFSDVRVLVLSIYESQDMIKSTFELGGQGYCVKDVSRKELIEAMMDALRGEVRVCRKAEMTFDFEAKSRPL